MLETMETIFAVLGLSLTIGTILRKPLESVADAFQEYAATTPTVTDDKVARHLAAGVGYFGQALDLVARILPVIASGKQARK